MTDRKQVIIFAPSQIGKAARIARMIESSRFPLVRAAVCTDGAMVRTALRTDTDACLAVLLASSRRELELMVDMAPWFEAVAVIIMVPDHRRKTIALAHRLRPRYIAWPEINYRELRMVLRHIVSRSAAGNNPLPDAASREPGYYTDRCFTFTPYKRRRKQRFRWFCLKTSTSGAGLAGPL